MNSSFTRFLSKLLIVLLISLPLRPVLAMDMVVPSDGVIAAEASEMSMPCHGSQQRDVAVMNEASMNEAGVDSAIQQSHEGCQCCGSCDGDCNGCTSMQAITVELHEFTDANTIELISISVPMVLTRTIPPPARPPLSINI